MQTAGEVQQEEEVVVLIHCSRSTSRQCGQPGFTFQLPTFHPNLRLDSYSIRLSSVKQLCSLKKYLLISKWKEVGRSVHRNCARIVMLSWCPGAVRALAWEKERDEF